MWMFNITSGWWTWLSGTDGINQAGLYGARGFTNAMNLPGCRTGHSMLMHPSGKFIFVFGGGGYDQNNNKGTPIFNRCFHDNHSLIY